MHLTSRWGYFCTLKSKHLRMRRIIWIVYENMEDTNSTGSFLDNFSFRNVLNFQTCSPFLFFFRQVFISRRIACSIFSLFLERFRRPMTPWGTLVDKTCCTQTNIFQNLIKSNRNQIVFSIFRLIWNQTAICLVLNQSENGKYNLI